MQPKIRNASVADLSDILKLYTQPELDNGAVLSFSETTKLFHCIESYPNYSIYVACINGEVVGTFGLLIMHNLGHQGALSGIVEDVVVDPNLHREGIGKAMMHFAMQKCKENKCYKLSLSTNLKRKNAHLFYESLGFKKHGFSYTIHIS